VERSDRSGYDGALTVVAACVFLLVLLLVGVEHYWLRDLKFDDAWIHFRYARNIARGDGFVFNAGERVLGSGGLLWEVVLAPFAFAAGESAFPDAVSVLNFGLLIACAVVAWRTLAAFVPSWFALLVATLLIAHGPLVVSSIGGMETTLLCLCYLVTFRALVCGRFTLASLVAGAAVCVRIESAPLAIATVLAALSAGRREAGRAVVAAVSLPAASYLFAWLYFGSPIPTSTLAKRIVYVAPPYLSLQTCLAELLNIFPFQRLMPFEGSHPFAANMVGSALWAVLVWRGWALVWRRSGAASLVVLQPLGAFVFYAATNPLMFRWYVVTFAPLGTLFAILGLADLARVLPGGPTVRYAGAALAAMLLSIAPMRDTWSPLVPPTHPRFHFAMPNASESARTYQYENIARWLAARARPEDRVCISEIGAFGYHFPGRILDGMGLVSPEVLRYHPVPIALRGSGILGVIPPAVVRTYQPELVVSFDVFARALFQDEWFNQRYELIGRWPWFGGPVRWRDLPATLWGGVEMRAYRRKDLPWPAETPSPASKF
jgi:hypothetical protein